MQTLDSLPRVPQAEMKEIMKEFKKIDESMQSSAPGDIIAQLTPHDDVQEVSDDHRVDTVPETQQSDVHHPNFSALRAGRERAERDRERAERERERAERERDELMARLREYELQRLQQQTQVSPAAQDDSLFSLAPDALAEGKHVNDLNHHVSKKIRQLEDQIKNYQQKTTQAMMEAQLKAQYPDFDRIVSKDNVEELRRSHPTIAQAIATAASSDTYSAASSLYTIIKEMGIAKSTQESSMNRRILQENASKPRSAQAASPQRGTTPLSQANEYIQDGKMSSEYQDRLLKEMNAARLQGRR